MTKSTIRNSIEILQHNNCCGCKACGDVCPKGAISFQKDNEGFLYPVVDENCVSCGLCVKVCPELNQLGNNNIENQIFLGCLDKDASRRNTGSSGGIFGLLATHLIKQGYFVYGAAFDNNLQLKHTSAHTKDELLKLKKSKYIQSDTKGVYKEIKKRFSQEGKVMFVGTPCQCNALRNYLGDSGARNALIVDFACHGVPSQDLFDRCINYYEVKHNCKVLEYGFRHKTKHYRSPQNYELRVQAGDKCTLKTGKYYNEPFYCGFQKYITLRPSCYHCKWANLNRVSDITLADFWGIETVTKRWDRRDHPSLVILNTDKGHSIFNKIQQDVDCITVTSKDATRVNGSLDHPTKKPQNRERLFSDLEKEPFNVIITRYLTDKHIWLKDLYYYIPFGIRKMFLKLLGKL